MGMQTSHSPDDIRQSINSTAVKLLQAAAESLDDEKQLAMPLGTAQSLRGYTHGYLHRTPDRTSEWRLAGLAIGDGRAHVHDPEEQRVLAGTPS